MLTKFTFLGTGTSQGIPVIGCNCQVCKSTDSRDKRLRCSLLIETDSIAVCIDIGPDFRQQMLRENATKLDAIVLTHEHMDHLAGLDEIRAFNFTQRRSMKIYATERVQLRLKEQYSYIFINSNYPGIPQIELITIDTEPFEIGDIRFEPIELMHGSMPVLGFRMGEFTYITDANFIEETSKAKIKECQHLVLNALRKEPHYSHFTLQEAINLSNELEAANTYFTHISHQMGLHKYVQAELPSGKQIAYDGLVVEVP